ncbi:MAG: tryptophan synthase subunit alpha, partial [Candidatus Lokiarchaeota archaeon]|nr:tryptophan synthase subunit alpha [Candidatus Lokiarchaeota archaeon]
PIEMIRKVKKFCDLPLIVGGGVNTPEEAREKVLAGADIIVQGTFIEENIQRDGGEALARIIQAIKEAGREKIAGKQAKDVTGPEAGDNVPRVENGVPGN